MPSSRSAAWRGSGSASSRACERSERASVPSWVCVLSASLESFAADSASRVTFSRVWPLRATRRRIHETARIVYLPGQRSTPGLARRDVLVDPEEVVRVVLLLQRLQPVVLLRPVGLPNSLRSLVAEEVHVHAFVPGLQGRPEAPHPLALLVEALARLGRGADVVGEPRRAAVEGGLVVAYPADRSAHLPDRERRQRRFGLERPLDGDVEDLVARHRD